MSGGYPFNGKTLIHERTGFPYSERHIQCLWNDIRSKQPVLQTCDGRQFRVLHPGRWNREAGPDFLGAELQLEPELRRITGDIEIHTVPEDWNHHGHQNDPAYHNVIAHVTYLPGTFPETPPDALQIVLRQNLPDDPAILFEDIDITAYPYHHLPVATTPCATRLAYLSPAEKQHVLEDAGLTRLQHKSLRLRKLMENFSEEQVFYETVMAALGYRRNAAVFRRTARALPVNLLHHASEENPEYAYALLSGTAGLLPHDLPPNGTAQQRRQLQQWWNIWWHRRENLPGTTIEQKAWNRSGLRPANFPERRMMAAAIWFCHGNSLWRKLCAVAEGNDAADVIKAMRQTLQDGLQHNFWSLHYTFSGKKLTKPVRLLGHERIAALINNAVLPLLAATGHDVSTLARQSPQEAANSITRQTAYSLFGPDCADKTAATGLQQQGLIQIFSDFCSHPGVCRRCNFASAFENRTAT